jgi:hypothetical protein
VHDAGTYAHPGFAPYRRWLRDHELPGVETLNAWARDADLRLPDGRALSFVEGSVRGALAYESAILRAARIPVRRDSWHDTYNALAWLAFPRTKAALNACHVAEGRGPSPNARTRVRDAATLLDESGLVIGCSDDSLRGSLREQAWRSLFVDRHGHVVARLHARVIGHGLLARLRAPYRALTARVLWLPVDLPPDAAQPVVDDAVAAGLRAQPPVPGDLLRLPVAALPGWDPEALGAALFDDVTVFRSPRATLAAS